MRTCTCASRVSAISTKTLKKIDNARIAFQSRLELLKKCAYRAKRTYRYRRLLFTKERTVRFTYSHFKLYINRTSMGISDRFMDRFITCPTRLKQTWNNTWELDPWRQSTSHGSAIVIQHLRFTYTTNFHYSHLIMPANSHLNKFSSQQICSIALENCRFALQASESSSRSEENIL